MEDDEISELYLLSRFAPSSSTTHQQRLAEMPMDQDLSSELDPALVMSTSTSSSSPPDSAASPSSSFSLPSPPRYTFAVNNLSCPAPRRRAANLLPSFLSYSSSAAASPTPDAAGAAGLLKSVSFTASSSNILAVVGPSGAGKSTLLRILSGRGTGSEIAKPGTVSLNGHAVTSRAQLRRLCGFVTQDDNLLPLLTVRETILFAARFRLRAAATAAERNERVEALMQELGLSDVADSYVGGGDGCGGLSAARGVSGGERKRVSIAVDIVHDPPVLLLDEPTSGLDSRSALDVLQLLHDVSRARRQVVVLSIHQPSYRMLHYISSLLLLSRGAVAHVGTLASLEDALARLGHKIPMQLNPLELAMEVTGQLEEDSSSRIAEHNADDEDEVSGLVSGRRLDVPDQGYCSRFTEVATLTVRCWRTMYRTRELFAARAAQAVVGGLGLGSVYFRLSPDSPDGVALRLGLFAFTLSFLLSSTVEALPILLHERRVLMREASRRAYRLSSYVLANALVFAPCLLAVSLLFSAPLYWLAGLRATPLAAFALFVLAVWLIMLMASSLVLFLSAVSPDFVLGNALICVFLGVFFLFSGYFIPKDNIPRYWAFMYYVSMYRYPLDLLLINEYGGSARGRCVAWMGGKNDAMPGGVCLRTGADVLRDRGIDEGMRWVNVGVMLGFFLLYRILCWAVLVRRASKTTL
ncbi:ABC transporter G family member 23 [Zea mays]|uniref:ATPase, coupled to transmembrane movement of substances n=2 Tax=Zea mays TaxID=4577 RepID=B6SXQ6_MAIZE|nr:ATPase, coupled to transmembrane movement of substances [Zea mays]PWZ17785.1 ABC transporter G family member 23 [Zea mays]